MGDKLGNLKPKVVWDIFEEMCAYPRPSKKEDAVIEYVLEFCDKHGLEYLRDDAGNVIIRVPATPGFENKKTVILQGHLDMVCEKNANVEFDFETEGIRPYIDGDWVKAEGTTLGADNGIGASAALAVAVDETAEHGPLEILLTLDEETGLTGATNLGTDVLEGDYLLNLDSEEIGEIYIGCSGGRDTKATLSYAPEEAPPNYNFYEISVTGLRGGHSGMEIHQGRGNAIKIIGRLLNILTEYYVLSVGEVNGGSKRNAIPREAFAVIAVDPEDEAEVLEEVAEFNNIISAELSSVEPSVQVQIKKMDERRPVLDETAEDMLVLTLCALPHGVLKMSADIPGLVETSTNLATVSCSDGEIVIGTSQRSSVESEIEEAVMMVKSVFQLAGAVVETEDGYPGWKPDVDSVLLKIGKEAYISLFGKEPEVKAIHAGLECGIIKEKYPHIDMISFGPTMTGVHSPDEQLFIPSVEKFWHHLLKILETIPER
ncbi:MAG: aminoacyl-histidine dipeptidase [Ignavibacteriales bacterium]|nr:MAG: aminoacyl-histidine dipeptidase [Ignavibacteriaceae bacterium]MBW7872900.1 aminoacyl-histidine dipeptidase [Ignavibacteria bacterium]MCZ2142471.1 aminoacyl-histidine dipeptidase [Ignavibacteriales bacterium]OQY76283.1 MAG: cytosol nonspecific dipeptidase [Ignavibacteriales bacterium UTCHB3]MBV6445353.1 Cytosol non-specific dipeptidase [Ignavibacteriaceae bacterium]